MREYLKQIFNNFNKSRNWLVISNILLVFFLILLSNLGVLPVRNVGDFVFFVVLVLIFALYRPGWAFLFFVGTIALENVNLAPEIVGIAVRPYQLLGAASLIAVIVRYLTKRLPFAFPKWNWIDALILVFVASGFVSALASSLSKGVALKQSIVIASFSALYFLTRIFIQDLKDVKKIIPYFLSSSVVVIGYGIWQNWRFVRGLSHFEVMPGRPNATFSEADWLGIFLVLLISFVYSILYYFQNKAGDDEEKISNFQFLISKQFPILKLNNSKFKIKNFFLYLILTSLFLILILTVARSAWLGAGVVSILYLVFCIWYYFKNKNSKVLRAPVKAGATLIVAIILIKIFSLTNFELGNRIQSTGSGLQEITISCEVIDQQLPETIGSVLELQQYGCRHINLEEIESEEAKGNSIARIKRDDPNVNIRAEIYQKSWKQIKDHPILGIGWGNISQILGTDNLGNGLNASNIFLEIWLGAGLLGIVSFIVILGLILMQGIRLLYEGIKSQESRIMIFGFFIILSLCAIVVPNLFNSGIMLGFLWIWLAIAQVEIAFN
jgi:hypothetical protein